MAERWSVTLGGDEWARLVWACKETDDERVKAAMDQALQSTSRFGPEPLAQPPERTT